MYNGSYVMYVFCQAVLRQCLAYFNPEGTSFKSIRVKTNGISKLLFIIFMF